MKKLIKNLILLVCLGGASVSQAVQIFSDNFDSENGGNPALNFNSFSQWTVDSGSVDLIGNGYFDFLPGNGLYLDLDGSTGAAGTITSSSFFLAPGDYVLNFDLAGSQRGDSDTANVAVNVGLAFQQYTLASSVGFTPTSLQFTVASGQSASISFSGLGGDNIGLLLDNVSLSSVDNNVPDGGFTLALLGGTLSLLGIGRRFVKA
ncbi:MAG: hypothetical protein JWM59_2464 [Verrucomicrobiales bacterium]|nr:hypothetical protein [Verrucomicrobiales bacterium]